MKVVKEKAKELTPELATQFGTLVAKRKELQSEEDVLKPKIKELMQEDDDVTVSFSQGANGKIKTYSYAPRESPYELVYSEFQGTDISWKDEFKVLYEKTHGKGSFKKFARSLAQRSLKDCNKLEPRPNPNYKP